MRRTGAILANVDEDDSRVVETPNWVSAETRYHLLADAVQGLSGARVLEDVIEIVRSTARSMSGAAGVAIVLREGDSCHYVAEDSESPLWAGQRFPLVTCVSGWAMLNRETAVIPDIFKDARIPHEAYRQTFVRSLVMTPVGDTPFAAIGAYWPYVRNPATEEVDILALLARATATAFRNVELIQSLETAAKRHAALNRDLLERIREREEAEASQAVIVRELNHRTRNLLSVVKGIANQTFRSTEPAAIAASVFEARLVTMARAHAMVTSLDGPPPMLRDLVRSTLEPFDPDADRVSLAGPEMRLPRRSAVTLALAVHELATNAAKYGALSNDEGTVSVRWTVEGASGEERFSLTWTESGGPPVVPPARRGLGSQLIEQSLAADLRGSARLDYRRTGLVCAVEAPLPVSETGALSILN